MDKIKILIFEDNITNKFVIQQMLIKLGAIDLTFVENGQEGIKLFKPNVFQLIFLDIKMPIMDGYEVIKHLTTTYKKEELPYIVGLTANAMEEERQKCLSLGMNEYITKPFKIEQLKNLLTKFI